jgi:general secretion pathway protein N
VTTVQWRWPHRDRPGHPNPRFGCLHLVGLIVAAVMLTPAQAGEPSNLGNPLWKISPAELTETMQRPLFSPSRRPPPPVVPNTIAVPQSAPPRAAEPDHPLLTLVGTIIGEQSMAIFLDDTSKNVVRLLAGQDHGGWQLRSVLRREVEFEKEHRTARLILSRDGPQTISTTDSDVLAQLITRRRRGGRSH